MENIWSAANGNIYERAYRYAENEVAAYFTSPPSGSSPTNPNPPDVFVDTKFERNLVNEVLTSSEDIYQVSVQGIAGTFRPFFEYAYEIKDEDDQHMGKYNLVNPGEENTGAHIQFRFEGDQGGNFVSLTTNWGDNLDTIRSPQYGSKIIRPAIDPVTGQLLGFEITAEDGKIYEFYRPVHSLYQHSRSEKIGEPGTYNETTMSSPYATAWLLTGIKGPDYVDRTNNGFSSDDYGFWVHFAYQASNRLTAWRTPYPPHTWSPSPGNSEWHSYSEGAKTKLYLKSIETATHIAQFHLSPREDNLGAILDSIRVTAVKLESYTGFLGGEWLKATFPFDKSIIMDIVTPSTELGLEAFYSEYTPPVGPTVTNHYASALLDTTELDLYPSDGFWTIHTPFPHGISINGTGFVNNLDLIIRTSSGYLNTEPFAQKLDMITIHKKVVDNEGKTDYTASFANPVLESIRFEYDYSLMRGANNSNAPTGGKLTLRNIQKFGRNGYAALPKTEFYYYGEEVPWSEHKWDYWNGYTSIGTEEGHFPSQNKFTADADAATWNLKEIVSPLGARTIIEYESDQIDLIRQADVSKVAKRVLISQYTPNSSIFTINDPQYVIKSAFDAGIFRYFWILEKEVEYVYSSCDDYYDYITFTLHDVEVVNISSDNQVELTTSFGFRNDIGGPCGEEFDYTYYLVPKTMFAGGHRVKSVTLTDGINTQKTLYRYHIGITPVLPSEYKRRFISWEFEDETLLLDGSFNALGPSPSVGYASVEVMEVDPATGLPLNGKTVHEFYTAIDYPFTVNEDTNLITIQDKTGIYGRPKAITVYGLKEGATGQSEDDFYPLKRDEFIYKFSSELLTGTVNRKIFKRGDDITPGNTRLGITQQKYRSKNQTDPLKKLDIQKENVFMVGTRSTTYFYDEQQNPVGSMVVEMDNIGYDAISGKVLLSRSLDSKGQQAISENIPAYWQYPDMEAKNMLTQLAGTKGYILPNNIDFWTLSLPDKHQYLKSAEVTTWKDWGNGVWRQNDTYTALKTGSAFTEFDFDNWSVDDEETNPAGYDFPDAGGVWKRTSNIIRYDAYGHPVEERSVDGTYTASLYGYHGALPVAIATNARLAEISATSFENTLPGPFMDGRHPEEDGRWGEYTNGGNGSIEISDEQSYTGVNSLKLIPNTGTDASSGIVLQSNASENAFQKGRKYVISAWVKSNTNAHVDISYRVNGNDTYGAARAYHSGSGEWEYLETSCTIPDDPGLEWVKFHLQVLGQGNATDRYAYFDEVRIYPADARMSSFAYDPDTWQVTAITDANGVTTYYEYDDAGRLIRVRDQDRNLIARHEYRYGQGAMFYYSPVVIPPGTEVFFYAQASTLPTGGEITQYEWQLTGPMTDSHISPDPFWSKTLDVAGTYHMKLIIYDQNGPVDTITKEVRVSQTKR
ncbi:MAG: hypothetical protein D6732_18210 [Methanobacteriota archaeon]|nr:MAG: hypothetical protein D6732_18210 [Euryarchaeota archaeon]